MRNGIRAALVLALLTPLPIEAWSYDIDLGPLGHACDTCGGGVVGGLPVIGPALTEAQAQIGGAALEQWINASRDSAASGAMPIPAEIRRQLTGYASEASMDRVRYKIGDSGFLNVAHMIEQGGYADAVTLDNIVVFRGPSEANDPSIWAHELIHIDQYMAWGVHDFAIRYVRDHDDVENPAYAQGNGYWSWAQNHVAIAGPAPTPMPMGMPPAVGWFCYTAFGRFGPGPMQPLGSPCYVNGPMGTVWGQVGQ